MTDIISLCIMTKNYEPLLNIEHYDFKNVLLNNNIIKFIKKCPDHIFIKFIDICDNIDAINSLRYSIMHYCCIYGSSEKISYLLDKDVSIDFPCSYHNYDKANNITTQSIKKLYLYETYPLHLVCLYKDYDIIFRMLNKSSDHALKELCLAKYYYKGYKHNMDIGLTYMSIYDILFYKKNITNDQYMNIIYNIQSRIEPKTSLVHKIYCFFDITRIKFDIIFDYVYYYRNGKKCKRERFLF